MAVVRLPPHGITRGREQFGQVTAGCHGESAGQRDRLAATARELAALYGTEAAPVPPPQGRSRTIPGPDG